VTTAILVDYYNELPTPKDGSTKAWETRLRAALDKFKEKVSARYSEGTLQRLLNSDDVRARRAALLALGLLGDMAKSNAAVAAKLHDSDRIVRQIGADALWSLWFRAGSPAETEELRRILELRDRRKKRSGLDALIGQSPRFAEAYNQRAILHFQTEEWHKSIADCERVLKLNPYHFGAAAGLGRCYLEIGKHRAALKAFRHALNINPGLDDVEEAIRALESALGEEGRRDDKK
jgi:tetratricopeptide (TPR) repeat protein